MSEREIRYCTAEDGVRIAYNVTGEGPPLIVCHEGLESFTLDHVVTGLEDFFDELGAGGSGGSGVAGRGRRRF